MSFHSVPELNPIETLNSLKTSSLIFPIVSIGNIPQLTIDLLIHNYPDFVLVGKLDDLFLYPFASPIDYPDLPSSKPPQGIASALDIYYSKELKVTVLQQRSPILPGYAKQFFETLIIPFILTVGFDNVFILNSNDNGLKEDKFENKKFQIWSSNITSLLDLLQVKDNYDVAQVSTPVEISSTIDGIVQLFDQENTRLSQDASTLGSSKSEQDLVNLLKENYPLSLPLSRASSTKKLLSGANEKDIEIINLTSLSIFAYEGDNSNDAELLTSKISFLLKLSADKKLDSSKYVKPRSWRGVYGDKPVPSGVEFGVFT